MANVIWSCPNCATDLHDDLYAQFCATDLHDDLYAQFGLWCPECEQVIPWASLPRDYDGDDDGV